MNCSKCNKPKPIINKKHWLCMDCNFERLHKGVSRVEIYKERAKDRVEFKTPRIVRTKINQQTSKEKTIKKELSEIKKSIDQEAIENGTYFCQGCGKSNGLLDKSHILSVGQRKDLELDKENMNLFCRECHTNYESGNMEKMIILNSFEKDLNYIKKNDPRRYNKLLIMIEDLSTQLFDMIIDRAITPELKEKVEYFTQNYDYLLP